MEPEMKTQTNAKWVAPLLLFVFAVITGMGLYYRIYMKDFQVQKYGGLTVEDRQIAPLEKKAGKIIPGVDLNDYMSPGDAVLTKGKELFTLNCASCHGNEGKGDGPASVAFDPKPRTFTNASGWKNGSKLTEIYGTLQVGLLPNMPAFDYLKPEERLAIISHIRTLAANFPTDSKSDLAALDKQYNLSAGTKEPNTIPYELAAALVKEENKLNNARLNGMLINFKSRNNADMALVAKYATNVGKLFTAVLKMDVATMSNEDFAATVRNAPDHMGFNAKINFAQNSELYRLKGVLADLTR
jgi:mono/diheme cytochrome c family protein